MTDREALREAIDWLRDCSDWLLSNDLDMQMPDGVLDTDPLDIADQLETLASLPSAVEAGPGRDIFELANQLAGYVGPDTDPELAAFLLRESKEAAKLAYEVEWLRKQCAAAPQPAEPTAALIPLQSAIDAVAHGVWAEAQDTEWDSGFNYAKLKCVQALEALTARTQAQEMGLGDE